jgi:hypothetical protein
MNLHEQAFVAAFIHADRRERFLAALASPKKRAIFNRQLHHPKPSFLLAAYVERIVPSHQTTAIIAAELRSRGATDRCWVFGNRTDGCEMGLEEALDEVIGTRAGSIVSCVPGKLAFFENEDERVILHKV